MSGVRVELGAEHPPPRVQPELLAAIRAFGCGSFGLGEGMAHDDARELWSGIQPYFPTGPGFARDALQRVLRLVRENMSYEQDAFRPVQPLALGLGPALDHVDRFFARTRLRVLDMLGPMAAAADVASRTHGFGVCRHYANAAAVLFKAIKVATGQLQDAWLIPIGGSSHPDEADSLHAWNWFVGARGALVPIEPQGACDAIEYANMSSFAFTLLVRAQYADCAAARRLLRLLPSRPSSLYGGTLLFSWPDSR